MANKSTFAPSVLTRRVRVHYTNTHWHSSNYFLLIRGTDYTWFKSGVMSSRVMHTGTARALSTWLALDPIAVGFTPIQPYTGPFLSLD